MKKLFKFVNRLIKKYETIVVARHVYSDLDCLGAQFGLKEWININYPNKKVYCVGVDHLEYSKSFFPKCDKIDKIEEDFLAICVDVNTIERIDNKELFIEAKETICIDHHPYIEPLEFNHSYIDSTRVSCCEIVGEMLLSSKINKVNKKICKYLYSGIVSDSADFYYAATDDKTLLTASKLVKVGKFNPFHDVNIVSRQNSFRDLQLTAAIIDQVILNENFAYYIIDLVKQKELGITSNYATQKIYRFNRIVDFEIVLAAAEESRGIFRCSIRSKHVDVASVAVKYGGGGHKNACGVKNLTPRQLVALRKDLIKLLNVDKSSE